MLHVYISQGFESINILNADLVAAMASKRLAESEWASSLLNEMKLREEHQRFPNEAW